MLCMMPPPDSGMLTVLWGRQAIKRLSDGRAAKRGDMGLRACDTHSCCSCRTAGTPCRLRWRRAAPAAPGRRAGCAGSPASWLAGLVAGQLTQTDLRLAISLVLGPAGCTKHQAAPGSPQAAPGSPRQQQAAPQAAPMQPQAAPRQPPGSGRQRQAAPQAAPGQPQAAPGQGLQRPPLAAPAPSPARPPRRWRRPRGHARPIPKRDRK